MYIDRIVINDIKTFGAEQVEFVHPDKEFGKQLPAPTRRNINLLLGENGSGKTTLLRAIAMTALGPAVQDANFPIYRLIRHKRLSAEKSQVVETGGLLEAHFVPHAQDGELQTTELLSQVRITAKSAEVERPEWAGGSEAPWREVYNSQSDAFFAVGYGATRRVETREIVDPALRLQSSLARAQRLRSLFEDSYSLIPLSSWLPQLKSGNARRYAEVKDLINALLSSTGYRFPGTQDLGEFVFSRGGLNIPFPALSDGYRAYLGWLGDLLYHLQYTCPPERSLVEQHGVVMVDEVDLHLHPRWQMSVLPTLSKALPHIQFIFTSHSPLLVGSLEWMNILHMSLGSRNSSKVERIQAAVHGLDADQILLTDFFGLSSTRASAKDRRLRNLTLEARDGNLDAAIQVLNEMSQGMEGEP